MTATHAPITHPALDNMLGDIRHLLDQSPQRVAGATVLIMAAIDALGYIDRPAKQNGSPRGDFEAWVSKYLKLEDITTMEWWEARNAMIHTYGVLTQKQDKSGIPVLLVTYGNTAPFFRKQAGPQKLIFVHINYIHQALVAGVDKFLSESFADKSRWAIIEPRLNMLVQKAKIEAELATLVNGKT